MMIFVAFVCIIAGILCGQYLFSPSTIAITDQIMAIALILMMLGVGIEVGCNKSIFQQIKKLGLKILLIPLGVMLGTLLGGSLVGLIFDAPFHVSSSVSVGFGFFSLSTVLMQEMAGSQLATLSFFTNVLREILSLLFIPLCAKYLNAYTTVAPGAATSMDTVLPMITKYTDGKTGIVAVISGVILSAAVPVLVPFFYHLPW